ncbi:hypothetical protein [Planctomycetes bacterium K23_9]|uniref:Uncharacterized protein n=1 Tax=Stieleria marina TaxID=1930275 RepID=A0A517NSL6_9BACT|nr:hypothetical protein K239x_20750 [Planctomycetes bacterium K23_9]
MKKKHWISKLAAIAFLSFAVAQVHAFVNTSETVAVSEDSSALIDRIDSIATAIGDESLTSDEALVKINEIIDEIDGLLDTEPANEGELLDLRDALVDMRLEISGQDATQEQAVGACTSCGTAPAAGGSILSGGPIGGGSILGGGGGGFAVGGGGAIGGGGLASFLTSPLGIGAIAGTIVAVTAGGDDDDVVASMGATDGGN